MSSPKASDQGSYSIWIIFRKSTIKKKKKKRKSTIAAIQKKGELGSEKTRNMEV